MDERTDPRLVDLPPHVAGAKVASNEKHRGDSIAHEVVKAAGGDGKMMIYARELDGANPAPPPQTLP